MSAADLSDTDFAGLYSRGLLEDMGSLELLALMDEEES